MDEPTDKMPAMSWPLPDEPEEEELDIDIDVADGTDGATWWWNGSSWVVVEP